MRIVSSESRLDRDVGRQQVGSLTETEKGRNGKKKLKTVSEPKESDLPKDPTH